MKSEYLKKHGNKDRFPKIAHMVLVFIIFSGAPNSEAAPIGQCKNRLNIIQTQQIDFGDLLANTGGVVRLDTNNGVSLISGTVLPLGGGASGIYDISASIDGCDAYYVSISITPDPVLLSGPGVDMNMTTFVTRPTGLALDPIQLSPVANVPVQIYLGADLTVGNGQSAGTYNSIPYSVKATLSRNPPK